VAPVKSPNTLGEECDRAQGMRQWPTNATLMALLWDATANQERQTFSGQGLRACQASWTGHLLNYVAHDDIGFGFDDSGIRAVGYEPAPTVVSSPTISPAAFDGQAKGAAFKPRTMPRPMPRICVRGFTAGLETHWKPNDAGPDPSGHRPDLACRTGVILSFGGITR